MRFMNVRSAFYEGYFEHDFLSGQFSEIYLLRGFVESPDEAVVIDFGQANR